MAAGLATACHVQVISLLGSSQSSHWTAWHYAGAMSDLKGAIIGYGLAGSTFHAPLISSTPGLAVATVVTGNPERREQALRDHPGARVVSTPEELWELADEHDFVVIAARNDAHVPLAERALDAGLAVVVDKPLAPTAAEAAALVEHARASGKLLTVFQNRRWDSDHRTLRKLMAEGALGRRPALRVALRALAPGAAGGCVARDRGSGEGRRRPARSRQPPRRSGACSCSGRRATSTPRSTTAAASAGDDDAFVALRHRSGTYSHLWMSAVAAAPGPRLRVLGTRAAYVVAEVDGQEDALRSGRRPDDPGHVGNRAGVALGPARARARRARRFRASRARGRRSTQSSSARCARAARRRSIRPTRSRRSR